MVPSIFIVDDEPSLLEIFSAFITSLGYEIAAVASNGKAAIDMYTKMVNKPDLIIMDHRMPIKNGIEASAEILAMNPRQKIIMVTADQNIIEKAKIIGVVDIIMKPFEMADFLGKITAMTGASGRHDSVVG
ncbi:MAG: response regulator [Candidatus Lokiarchaeota archaeon]|nr:response regulator [Candidatus Lokiarchaeota archaeon]